MTDNESRSLSDIDIEQAVARYVRERDRFEKLVSLATEQCRALIRKKGIRASITGRSKSPESLRKKLLKYQRDNDPRYSSVDSVFLEMTDLAGVRIATYLESDRAVVEAEVRTTFKLLREPDRKDQEDRAKHYRAIHCRAVLRVDDDDAAEPSDSPEVSLVDNVLETPFEIQICSMLAHVWNEIEHDIGYKPHGSGPGEPVLDALEILGQLVHAGDRVIRALIVAHEGQSLPADDAVPFASDGDFAIRMGRHFPDAKNFTWYSAQLFDALLEFQLDSPQKIRAEILGEGDAYKTRASTLVAKVNEYIRGKRLTLSADSSTSDLLAVLFFQKRLAPFLEKHPTGRGHGRPSRLVSLGKRFEWMGNAGAS